MIFAAVPIGQTTINWEAMLRTTLALLKRSLAQPLDDKGVRDRGTPQAIVCLSEFVQRGTDYLSALREGNAVLKHFNASFLVRCDCPELMLQILSESDLRVLTCDGSDKLFIVSGTLYDWKNTVVNFGSCGTEDQAQFALTVLEQFDKLGLSELWANYSRRGGTIAPK